MRTLILSVAMLVSGSLLGSAGAVPGLERYTPTKLEWLVLELNASALRTLAGSNSGVFVSYAQDGIDAVRITVAYGGPMQAAALDGMVQSIEAGAVSVAAGHGWRWARFRTERRPF